MITGTYRSPAFQLGQDLTKERDGKVQKFNHVWIKLSTSFRPYLAVLTGNQIKVLISIALRINSSYESWPSLKTIANECKFHPSTASRAVTVLEEIGIVGVVRAKKSDGSWKVNRYRIKAHFAFGDSDPEQGDIAQVQYPGEPVQYPISTRAIEVLRLNAKEGEPTKREPIELEPDDDDRVCDPDSSSSNHHLVSVIAELARMKQSNRQVIQAACDLEFHEWVTPKIIRLWAERFWPEERPPNGRRLAPWPGQIGTGVLASKEDLQESAGRPAFWD